jgi:hypothetical protein
MYRTKKGNVTSKTRKQYGIKGKYPIFDIKSAISAIKLRHHSKDISPKTILNKVASSKFSSSKEVKRLLEQARLKDRSK